MAGIDEVLERLLTDAQFARHLAQDPASALAGYELTTDDLTLLSTQVSFDPGALSLVEERISKSSFFGLLTSITGGLGGGGGGGQLPETHYDPVPHLSPESHADVFYDMSPGIIGPDDSLGVVAPTDLEEVVGPSDSDGVIAPSDLQGALDPGDKVGADGIVIVGGIQTDDVAHSGGGGGGAGSEVSFKEVDPAPQPGAEALGTGGGGGAGGEVSIKEVDPAPQPSSEGEGIIVQGGLSEADGLIIQGGLTPPDGTVFEGNMDGSDGVVVQGGLTESEAVTYPI